MQGLEAGGKDLKEEIDAFKEMIRLVKKAYPNASTFATTLREVVSANHHLWGAIMASGDQWHVIEPRDITVLDRIGGGDGFVGGMLYGILKGWEPEKWAQFRAAIAWVTRKHLLDSIALRMWTAFFLSHGSRHKMCRRIFGVPCSLRTNIWNLRAFISPISFGNWISSFSQIGLSDERALTSDFRG